MTLQYITTRTQYITWQTDYCASFIVQARYNKLHYQGVYADVGGEGDEHRNNDSEDGEKGGVGAQFSLSGTEEKVLHVAVPTPTEVVRQVDTER